MYWISDFYCKALRLFIQPSNVFHGNGMKTVWPFSVQEERKNHLKKKKKLTENIYWRCYGQHERKSKLFRPCPSMMMKIMMLPGWLMNSYPKHFLSVLFLFLLFFFYTNIHFNSKPLLFNENIIHDVFIWLVRLRIYFYLLY